MSERLGHEDIETTLRIYHHVIEKTKSKVMKNTSDFARVCQEKLKKPLFKGLIDKWSR